MGRTDVPLNSRGEQQVHNAGSFFINKGIERIYCSPLSRARKTAEILSNLLKISNVLTLDGLCERNLGEFEGRQKTPENQIEIYNSPSIESMDDFLYRVKKALQSILWSPSTLVISHSGVYKCIISDCNFCSHSPNEQLFNAAIARIFQKSPTFPEQSI